MKVGIIQSNYLPWRGYFDFIASVDRFVIYDDVPYGTGKKWRNRNRLRTATGTTWMTVPVRHGSRSQPIDSVRICYQRNWIKHHLGLVCQNYRTAPHFGGFFPVYREILEKRHRFISSLNRELMASICGYLHIPTEIIDVRDLDVSPGSKSERPLAILQKMGADAYLTGPNTVPYADLNAIIESGIEVYIKEYQYDEYQQVWSPFIPEVSILDLIFNQGRETLSFCRSTIPDRRVSQSYVSRPARNEKHRFQDR